MVGTETKTCPICGRMKPLDSFDASTRTLAGRNGWCRGCEAQRIWWKGERRGHRNARRELRVSAIGTATIGGETYSVVRIPDEQPYKETAFEQLVRESR
jgi:hypothetical protein